MIERPDYLNKLISLKQNGRLKIITGIRRCGKSYLLTELFRSHLIEQGVPEDHIIYISFDDDENNHLLNPVVLSKHLKELIKDNDAHYFLLDEVQRIYTIINPIFTNDEIVMCKDPNDERAYGFQNVMNSLRLKKAADVYITGSNSRFLSRDIMTDFRDRGDEIHLQPLTFKEIADSRIYENQEQAFDEYMTYGGMPRVLELNDHEDKAKYLDDLFEMTYYKDVEERNEIYKSESLKTLTRILANNVGSLTNATKIANSFASILDKSMSRDTIENYLTYLEDAFIIKKVHRYDIKGKRQIGATYKYYFSDVGLRNSRVDFLHKDDGHVMENVVYNELIHRGFHVQVGIVEMFENDKSGKTSRKTLETDFVARKADRIYYIQSSFEMGSQEKIEQERKSLININDSFKKIIITRHGTIRSRDEDGVLYLGIVDFLLNPESIDA